MIPALRAARLLATMTQKEAKEYGVATPRRYFQSQGPKKNMGDPGAPAAWRELVLIDLDNATVDTPSDIVAAVAPWHPPASSQLATDAQLHEIKEKIKAGRWRENVRSPHWVGRVVAEVLKVDPDVADVRKKVASALRDWIAAGHLRCVYGETAERKPAIFVEVVEEDRSDTSIG